MNCPEARPEKSPTGKKLHGNRDAVNRMIQMTFERNTSKLIPNERCNVLLVEDIKADINLMKLVLEAEHDIAFRLDGESALEYIETHYADLDLIVVDIMLPGMDGYELCQRLKKDSRTRDIPVIFITAKRGEKDESRGLELGAVDYIIKPFSRPIVRARVNNHLIIKKQRDFLKKLTNIDGLTGISNRRHFDWMLETEWQRATRASEFLALLMIDIDFFKRYNDNYGHAAGDDCLREVARALRKFPRRSSDHVARYGGEEFAIILPDTDARGAAIAAGRLKDGIESLKIEHVRSPIADHVTISLGAAAISPPRNNTPPVITLIRAADEALYEAKAAGRNRMRSKEPGLPIKSTK